MSYSIGSFNLYKFSGQHDQEIAKDVRLLAEIIRSEKFDVIALQEMQATDQPKDVITNRRLLMALGSDWDMVGAASDSPKYHAYSEGYVFIWNKRRLRLVDDTDGRIFDDFGMKNKLVRPPLFARFTPEGLPGGSFFELRLINVHVAFGKPTDSMVISDVDYRRKELEILSKEVYPRIADKRYGNNMPAYTILMGDYNLCISGNYKIRPWDISAAEGFVDIPITSDRFLRTMQAEKTTLKRESAVNASASRSRDMDAEGDATELFDQRTNEYYSQDYDHFSIDTDTLSKIGVSVSKVDALARYYQNRLSDYRREISDHVPIKMTIDLRTR